MPKFVGENLITVLTDTRSQQKPEAQTNYMEHNAWESDKLCCSRHNYTFMEKNLFG